MPVPGPDPVSEEEWLAWCEAVAGQEDHLHRNLLAVRHDAVVHGPHPAPAQTTAQRDAAELGRVGWLEGVHAHLPSSRNEIT